MTTSHVALSWNSDTDATSITCTFSLYRGFSCHIRHIVYTKLSCLLDLLCMYLRVCLCVLNTYKHTHTHCVCACVCMHVHLHCFKVLTYFKVLKCTYKYFLSTYYKYIKYIAGYSSISTMAAFKRYKYQCSWPHA